jgi:hypothetical protein
MLLELQAGRAAEVRLLVCLSMQTARWVALLHVVLCLLLWY